jgi:hypothetical protein
MPKELVRFEEFEDPSLGGRATLRRRRGGLHQLTP